MTNQINTSDLYDRYQELDSFKCAVESAQEALDNAAEDQDKELLEAELQEAKDNYDDNMQVEYEQLENLINEMGLREFKDGVLMIPDDEFTDYTMEYAEDMGVNIRSWPYSCIDWTQAADVLRLDYTSCEYDGMTYYYR